MLLALAALLLATAAFLAGEVVTQPARERRRSVRPAAAHGPGPLGRGGGGGARPRGFRPAGPRRLVPRTAPAGGDPFAAPRCARPARSERRGGACLRRCRREALRAHGGRARRRVLPHP